MTYPKSNQILGALKAIGLLQGKHYESLEEFLQDIPNLYSVEIPESVTNVVVSNEQPGDDEREKLWVRVDNAGNFVGLCVYAKGAWQQVAPAPQQLFRVYGDSRYIPAGYLLADESTGKMTSLTAKQLKQQWVRDSTDSYYVIFDVIFTGF